MTHARPARFIHRSTEARVGGEKPPDICEQAFALIGEQTLPKRTVAALARMVPARQVSATRTMLAVDNLSGDFARALLAATPCGGRADDARGRQSHADCAGRLARTEQGLLQMQRDCAELRSHYNDDLIYLALAASFIRKWMRNEVVASWLHLHHPKFAIVLDALVTAADVAIEPGRPMKLPYSPTSNPAGSRKSSLSKRSGSGAKRS
ncbi:plasmid partitioning protein RepB C-terminal domain-containing protein [Paraburkholderia agricolaris]|uniref:plasmid partitioning protein RepB C-terminal domain-containing protein n=1 Tax=Paraburkholderia agricolaris TaxID=2152888 RepID=UPI0038B9D669